MGMLSWFRQMLTRRAMETTVTGDYEAYWTNWQSHAMNRRPVWSYFMADLMLLDHQVFFGVCLGNAPLMSLEVEVAGPHKEINEFVADQFKRIWSTSASHIFRAKYYGYIAAEIVFQQTERGWEIEKAVSRHPRDTRPLFAPENVGEFTRGDLVGVRIRGLGRTYTGVIATNSVSTDLPLPKSCWLTYDAEYGQYYGRAALERSYGAWWDKAMPGGAYDLRRLRNVKDSWIGDVLKYPISKRFKLPDGTEITARDLARQIGEARVSGGVVVIPSDTDDKGNPYFAYQPPHAIAGEEHAKQWISDLDDDIFDGLLLPREVVEAAATGSGFSGRSVPMMMFLGTRDLEASVYVRELNNQVFKKLVEWNFGGRYCEEYTIQPIPLLETVGQQLGGGGIGGPLAGPNVTVVSQGGLQFSAGRDSEDNTANAIVGRAKAQGRAIMGDVRRRLDELLGKKKTRD